MKLSIQKSSRKRPFGVSIIIFLIIANLLSLTLVVFISHAAPVAFEPEANTMSVWLLEKVSPVQSQVLLLIIIAFQLTIAVGLWHLQRWAWVLLMIWQGWLMAVDIWGRLNGHPSYLTMFINVIIIFYINQREVKKAFSGKTFGGEIWTT